MTYDDVVDGARWAIQQGITEPQRVCIVGISDLSLLIDEGYHWVNADSIKKQIGTNPDKLKRDSPRLHAPDFKVPLLMLHGKMDAQVPFEQSEVMDQALTRAHIPHRFTVVPDADHPFSTVKDRATLLHEIETFLDEHLPVAATGAR